MPDNRMRRELCPLGPGRSKTITSPSNTWPAQHFLPLPIAGSRVPNAEPEQEDTSPFDTRPARHVFPRPIAGPRLLRGSSGQRPPSPPGRRDYWDHCALVEPSLCRAHWAGKTTSCATRGEPARKCHSKLTYLQSAFGQPESKKTRGGAGVFPSNQASGLKNMSREAHKRRESADLRLGCWPLQCTAQAQVTQGFTRGSTHRRSRGSEDHLTHCARQEGDHRLWPGRPGAGPTAAQGRPLVRSSSGPDRWCNRAPVAEAVLIVEGVVAVLGSPYHEAACGARCRHQPALVRRILGSASRSVHPIILMLKDVMLTLPSSISFFILLNISFVVLPRLIIIFLLRQVVVLSFAPLASSLWQVFADALVLLTSLYCFL